MDQKQEITDLHKRIHQLSLSTPIIENQIEELPVTTVEYFQKPDKQQRKLLIDENHVGPFTLVKHDKLLKVPSIYNVSVKDFKSKNLRLGFILKGLKTKGVFLIDVNNVYLKIGGPTEEMRHNFQEDDFDAQQTDIEFSWSQIGKQEICVSTEIARKTFDQKIMTKGVNDVESLRIRPFFYHS